MSLHIFDSQVEQNWIQQQENLDDGLLNFGQFVIEMESIGAIGLQDAYWDSFDTRTRRTTDVDSSDVITLRSQTFDSTQCITFLPNLPESAFYEELPLGVQPNARIVSAGYMQPFIDQVKIAFLATPDLATSFTSPYRWYGAYRTKSTFTVQWKSGRVLFGDNDQSAYSTVDTREYWAAMGSWEKTEFALQHYEYFGKFDRFETDINASFDYDHFVAVADLTALEALPNDQRQVGMVVYVTSEHSTYQLMSTLVAMHPVLLTTTYWLRVSRNCWDNTPWHTFYNTTTGFDRFQSITNLEVLNPIQAELSYRYVESLELPRMKHITWTTDSNVQIARAEGGINGTEQEPLPSTITIDAYSGMNLITSGRFDSRISEQPMEIDCWCLMQVEMEPLQFTELLSLDWELAEILGYGASAYGASMGQ